MSLLGLPSDILIIVLENLDSLHDLSSVALTCQSLHALVEDFGWAAYLRSHEHPSFSLSCANSTWKPRTRLRYDTLADHAWSTVEFLARPLSPPWQGKLQPSLAINTSRLVVGAGRLIYSYTFSHSEISSAPSVYFEGSCTVSDRRDRGRDITSLAFVSDGGMDRTLIVGFADGAVQRFVIEPYTTKNHSHIKVREQITNDTFPYHGGDLIESISSSGQHALSLSSSGKAVVFDGSDNPSMSDGIHLQSRSWSSYLSMSSSTSYAAFGTSSATPLAIHPLSETGLSPLPSSLLAPSARHAVTHSAKSLAVYGITTAPASAPWGVSEQIIVSGWYDGFVRVHDLRASTHIHDTDTHGPAPLPPVMSLHDPWSTQPIYCVSAGGGSSSYIAAGSARHSVVSFWDFRYPNDGWSVHAPGNDSSPVYSIVLESSRLFGATQSRAFVYDFGPSVTEHTYPSLPRPRYPDEALQLKKNSRGIDYYVTKYKHDRNAEVF
ncbi:hypothetical protein PLICRDRAFT_158450 [Plicaturopsis crispa FD-325 SS-3]|nr:hypothetical protein PLICRDRAFT_158450 [Plicaturopsis crispa FD-325 SS-3]